VLYVKTFSENRRFLADATRASVAEECRDAALDLLAGAARGWGKRELARWLVGPYAHATRHSLRGERVAMVDREAPITDTTIQDLLGRVRTQIVVSLEKAVLDSGALDFSGEIVHRGLVMRAVDAEGADVWFPRDAARLRLRDRVRSLLVAHYMNDPVAYDGLFVCHLCEGVSFDAMCPGHRRISGVVPRNADEDDEDPRVVLLK
jgi:hypothetical protein